MQSQFLVITRSFAGRTVVELLRSHFRLSPGEVRTLLHENGIRLGGEVCRDLTRRVRVGQRLHVSAAPRPRARDKERQKERELTDAPQSKVKGIRIVHNDPQLVVVDKPAGLTTVRHATEKAEFGARGQRFLPATLIDFLVPLIAQKQRGKPQRPRAVHRLDKDTSGLLVVARTEEAERQLGLQFRGHDVERTYLALVRGQAKNETITSHLIDDRGDRRRGSSTDDKGQLAVTHVRVVEKLGDFTLVQCTLETGRTHQVRIHLGERGTPLCGERIYDRPVHGKPLPDTSGALRPLLHAATLAFDHPLNRERLSFESPLPVDMRELLKKMRA